MHRQRRPLQPCYGWWVFFGVVVTLNLDLGPLVDNGLLIVELGGLEILIQMMSSPNVSARLNAVGCLMNLAAHGTD